MDQRVTLSFEVLAQKMGKDISLPACRAVNRAYRRASRTPATLFTPEKTEVMHQAMVEAQGPCFTVSPPAEPSDAFQFSSRGLTDWYVEQFVQLNSLKR